MRILVPSSGDDAATGPVAWQLVQLWVKRKSAPEHKPFDLEKRLDKVDDPPTEQASHRDHNKRGQASSDDLTSRFVAFTC